MLRRSGPSLITENTFAVTVGGVTVTGQYLAAVTEESDEFQSDPSDGLLGLAFPAISNLNHDPFFFTAVDQGTADEPVEGAEQNGGEILVGPAVAHQRSPWPSRWWWGSG